MNHQVLSTSSSAAAVTQSPSPSSLGFATATSPSFFQDRHPSHQRRRPSLPLLDTSLDDVSILNDSIDHHHHQNHHQHVLSTHSHNSNSSYNINGSSNSPCDSTILPYISIEGRRKRRRTTVEDAFESMTIDEATTRIGPDENEHETIAAPSPPSKHDLWQTHNAPPSTPEMNCIKRLKYDTPERNGQMVDLEFSSPIALQDTSMEPLAGCQSIRRRAAQHSSERHSNAFLDEHESDELSSCTTTTSQNSNSPEQEPSMYQLLFAPRKSKGSRSCAAATSSSSSSQALNVHVDQDCRNPVDLRLEELIRHSRIQAYVQQQHKEQETENMSSDGSSSSRNTSNFPTLRQLHKQQSHTKNGDCGGVYGTMGSGLRRKNSKIKEDFSSSFGSRSSDSSQSSATTTCRTANVMTRDDFHITLPKSRPNTPKRNVEMNRGRGRMTTVDQLRQHGRSRRSKSLPREVATILGVEWNNNPTKQSDMEMSTT